MDLFLLQYVIFDLREHFVLKMLYQFCLYCRIKCDYETNISLELTMPNKVNVVKQLLLFLFNNNSFNSISDRIGVCLLVYVYVSFLGTEPMSRYLLSVLSMARCRFHIVFLLVFFFHNINNVFFIFLPEFYHS